MRYKVTLTKENTYYIRADSEDEAERIAFDLDFESKDWAARDYYDKIEIERIDKDAF